MEYIILALMLLFAPNAPASELRPYATYLVRVAATHEVLAELFVVGRYEGLWGQRGVPMGVTDWVASHGGRHPNEQEAVCAAHSTVQNAVNNCGEGARNLPRRLGYYITGRCEASPEAQRRALSVRRTIRVLREFPIEAQVEELCGE